MNVKFNLGYENQVCSCYLSLSQEFKTLLTILLTAGSIEKNLIAILVLHHQQYLFIFFLVNWIHLLGRADLLSKKVLLVCHHFSESNNVWVMLLSQNQRSQTTLPGAYNLMIMALAKFSRHKLHALSLLLAIVFSLVLERQKQDGVYWECISS